MWRTRPGWSLQVPAVGTQESYSGLQRQGWKLRDKFREGRELTCDKYQMVCGILK